MEKLAIYEVQWPHKSRWSPKEGIFKDGNAHEGSNAQN